MMLTLLMVAALAASYALMFALVRFSENVIAASDPVSESGDDQADTRTERALPTAASAATLPH